MMVTMVIQVMTVVVLVTLQVDFFATISMFLWSVQTPLPKPTTTA